MKAGLDRNAIVRILQSLARTHARGSFLPGKIMPLPALAPDTRTSLAGDVAAFFALGPSHAAALDPGGGYGTWAETIHAVCMATGWTFTFHTSGSTGEPCPHVSDLDAFMEEARALAPYFTGRKRVVSVVPHHHVLGFAFAIVLPHLLGIPTLDLPPLPSAEFFRELAPGDLVLAFPVFWKSFLSMTQGPFAIASPPDIHGISSAAPCPPEIIEGLLAVPGEGQRPVCAAMTEVYGATEFGAIGIRRDCREPYTLISHWRRLHLESPEDGDPWGIARRGWPVSPLPDAVAWQGERHFTPLRRKDKAVQIGGVNVFPAHVADLLRDHPAVADCAVRMMRPEEGARLKAFIVPRTEADTASLAKELKHWLGLRLEPAATPKSFRFGESLPLTPSGKLADWEIGIDEKRGAP